MTGTKAGAARVAPAKRPPRPKRTAGQIKAEKAAILRGRFYRRGDLFYTPEEQAENRRLNDVVVASMRQRYETVNHLAAETAFKKKIEAFRCATLIKSKGWARIDYGVYRRERLIAIAELKCRDCRSDEYPTLMISSQKFDFGREVSAKRGVPFCICIRWTDRDGIYRDDPSNEWERKSGGRTVQTRDEWDEETCVYIPIVSFEEIHDERTQT